MSNTNTNADTAKPIYAMRYRPVSSCTLPRGVVTEWVRTPQVDKDLFARAFPHLERSAYTHGEFTTNRELSDDELEDYQIDRVDAPHKRAVERAELEERIDTLRTELSMFSSDHDEATALTQMIDKAEARLQELDTA